MFFEITYRNKLFSVVYEPHVSMYLSHLKERVKERN